MASKSEVKALVEAVTTMAQDRTTSLSTDNWVAIEEALAPFQFGKELPLIRKLNGIRTECCSCSECEGFALDKQIIDLVRSSEVPA